MSTILNVSLFLPFTIAFHDQPDARHETRQRVPVDGGHRRQSSSATSTNQPSLLQSINNTQVPSVLANEDFFAVASSANDANPNLLVTKSGDVRPLVHSDADVPEWGAQAIFNQPRSRAGPVPSGSILDFAKAHEELEARKQAETRSRNRAASVSASHSQSRENDYEKRSWTVEPAVHGNGGLVNAVRAAVEDGLVETTWIGTVGFPTDALSDALKEDIYDKLLNEYDAIVACPCDKDLDGHYAHYCKTILWPIFNYQVPDHPKSKAYADHSWEFYRRVNEVVAEAVVHTYKRGDAIWVHDYHLLLVPALVRQKLPDAQIGFFLHSAFPSSEVFRCLATRQELLNGMLGANLVAFQTDEYAGHFLQTCSRLLTVETTSEGVQLDKRFVNVKSQPIGIVPTSIAKARQQPEVQAWITGILDKYKNKKIIVARDKLDSVHGVRQKLLAYELFLNKYPEWAGKVVLIQVATSANEQSELLTTVSDICTRIDAVHSTLANQPLVFLKQDIAFSQYLALLSVADALIISALRDGMNLTAHEYILCQDGQASPKRYGPLLLSEFTGSHVLLSKKCLSINPWDYKGHADRIKQALEMDEQEKRERWEFLNKVVLDHTGSHWVAKLQETLDHVHDEQRHHASDAVPRLSLSKVDEKYQEADSRIFIIDYEGTLAPHRTSSGTSLSSPGRVLDTLTDLMADAKNVVYVMSGRQSEEMEAAFHILPSLGLIAENGCFLREFGAEHAEWQMFGDAGTIERWKHQVRGILNYYKERVEGSWIEERQCSLLFRYDRCDDQDAALRQAGDCADQINSSCESMRIQAVPVNKAVLVEQIDFSKGTAATHVFDELKQRAAADGRKMPNFMLVAGDDREDEVIFQWANELGYEGTVRDVFTVSVGRRNTMARATLAQGSTGLLTVLQKLAKTSMEGQPDDYVNTHRTNSAWK